MDITNDYGSFVRGSNPRGRATLRARDHAGFIVVREKLKSHEIKTYKKFTRIFVGSVAYGL